MHFSICFAYLSSHLFQVSGYHTLTMSAPSLKQIHCKHCPTCNHPEGPEKCLEDSTWSRKCKGKMCKDDLKRHTNKNHPNQESSYVGELKSRSVMNMFCLPTEPVQKRPRTADTLLPTPSVPPDSHNRSMDETVSQFNDPGISNKADNLDFCSQSQSHLQVEVDELSSHSSLEDDEETELLTLKRKKCSISKVMQSLNNLTLSVNKIMQKMCKKDNQVPYVSLANESCQNTNEEAESNADVANEDKTGIKTISALLAKHPCIKYDANLFTCQLCETFRFNHGSAKQTFSHSYNSELGTDFTNSNLPREFRNMLYVVKRHLTSKVHSDSLKWDEKIKAQKEYEERQSRQAGMNLGRLVYADLKRGRPISDYTENVMIASKNGSKVGDLNHSNYFPELFRENCAAVLDNRLKIKLQTPLACSGHKPPVGVMIDKMTQKKRTGQITAIQTLIPEAGPQDMVQVFFVGNPVVRDHTGKGVAKAAGDEVKKFCDPNQIVSFGGDGAYFNLGIERELNKDLKLSNKTTYIPDMLHRIGTAETDTRKDCQFMLDLISAIQEVLNDMRFGKKYENLLQMVEQNPAIKFYKIDSFSGTRFGNFSYIVFRAFHADIVLVITALGP